MASCSAAVSRARNKDNNKGQFGICLHFTSISFTETLLDDCLPSKTESEKCGRLLICSARSAATQVLRQRRSAPPPSEPVAAEETRERWSTFRAISGLMASRLALKGNLPRLTAVRLKSATFSDQAPPPPEGGVTHCHFKVRHIGVLF